MKVLASFDFNHKGRHVDYPDEVFDGRIWELRKGQDFQDDRAVHSVRSSLTQQAAKRGLKLRTSIPNDSTVVVQAYQPELMEEQ